MNGHTRALGFHPQTKMVQQHLLTQGMTLGVKGLRQIQKRSPKSVIVVVVVAVGVVIDVYDKQVML